MKIVFAGTPVFAATILEYLLDQAISIDCVYTQPDRPQGRGKKIAPSAVKQVALHHNLPVAQPASLRDADSITAFQTLAPDVFIVAAYGLLLPQTILNIPHFSLNVHPSLLPRWRGAAPIQRTILAGDDISGVCIMHMTAQLDAGPIAQQIQFPLDARITTGQLADTLAIKGAELLCACLQQIQSDPALLHAHPQATAGVTYAHKITKEDTKISWNQAAVHIDRQIRAFNPEPGASTSLQNQLIKVWGAMPSSCVASATPGIIVEIAKNSITVATGDGCLTLTELQLAGGKRLPVQAILNARRELFTLGMQFSS